MSSAHPPVQIPLTPPLAATTGCHSLRSEGPSQTVATGWRARGRKLRRTGRVEALPPVRQAPSPGPPRHTAPQPPRSEEHTSELQSLMRISYAVFCLKQKTKV